MTDPTRATIPEHAIRQAARLRQLARHRLHVLLGPVLLDPEPGSRRSYFMIAVAERKRWHFERVGGEDRAGIERFRAALLMALIQHRPIVIHDMDDELVLAQRCRAILPTRQIEAIVREITAERAAMAAFHHPASEALQ